jgi:3-hydroxyisobutyrate dehydrogenase
VFRLAAALDAVVVGDLVMDTEEDRFAGARDGRAAQRSAEAFDPDARDVRDVAHGGIVRAAAPRRYPRPPMSVARLRRAPSRVAFIGLGTMGRPMAGHLLAAGHELVACDADQSRAAALGTPTAATPAEAAREADVVFLSLPSPAAVEEVVLAAGGLVQGARRGTVVVDMSTCSPALARELGARLAEAGADFLDAPVSGGPVGAEAATLAIMVGGDPEVFERCRPLLLTMGALVERVGGHGAGQAVKLCNNLIVACTMAAIAEACGVLEREGIDPGNAYEVFTRSTSDSAVLRRRFPVPGVRPEHPASRDYEALFRLELLVKDLALALELAAEHRIGAQVAGAAARVYDAALHLGLGQLDYSAVYQAVERDG